VGSDQDKIAEIEATGVRLEEERWVTHSFGFTFNQEGAITAYEELGEFPFSIMSDQGDDEDYMDIATFRRHPVSLAGIAEARARMEDVAARHGGVYDGWWLTNPPSAERTDAHPFADFRLDTAN
jgi:hypothetical protein